jgi:peroxiredoxin
MELEALFQAAEQRWFAHWERGPTRRAWGEAPPQVGDQASDFELPDSTGRLRSLSHFWRKRPALVIFWRHFGCGCGVARAERLEGEHATFVEAGAEVVVIGQGEPERAAWYEEKFSIPCPILCDPDERTYRAYGLLECSPWLLLGQPPAGEDHFKGVIQTHRDLGRRVADNPFLLPGEFVVNTSGELVFTYRYQYCDNYPDPEMLVRAIREAAASETPQAIQRTAK